MLEHAMSREEAEVAVVTKDCRERHFGRRPLVGGTPLKVVYETEMSDGHLSTEQAAKVVSYLLGVGYDAALNDLHEKIDSGLITIETKH